MWKLIQITFQWFSMKDDTVWQFVLLFIVYIKNKIVHFQTQPCNGSWTKFREDYTTLDYENVIFPLFVSIHNSFEFLQVPIVIPIFMVLTSCYLIVAPIIDNPTLEFLYAFLFIIAGFIFYIPFVYFKYELPFMGKLGRLSLLFN